MLPNVHDPDYWVEELMPLLVDLKFALTVAIPKANSFFTDYLKKQVNRPLLSNLIRYFVLEYLNAHKIDAKEELEQVGGSWGMQNLSNNGIELIYKRSRVRFRKGIELPCPTTESTKDFYQQRLFGDCENEVLTNLMVLWDLNIKDSSISLRLVRPIDGSAKRADHEWVRKVELPAIVLTPEVDHEFMHPSDLPFAHSKAENEEKETKATGTE